MARLVRELRKIVAEVFAIIWYYKGTLVVALTEVSEQHICPIFNCSALQEDTPQNFGKQYPTSAQ